MVVDYGPQDAHTLPANQNRKVAISDEEDDRKRKEQEREDREFAARVHAQAMAEFEAKQHIENQDDAIEALQKFQKGLQPVIRTFSAQANAATARADALEAEYDAFKLMVSAKLKEIEIDLDDWEDEEWTAKMEAAVAKVDEHDALLSGPNRIRKVFHTLTSVFPDSWVVQARIWIVRILVGTPLAAQPYGSILGCRLPSQSYQTYPSCHDRGSIP